MTAKSMKLTINIIFLSISIFLSTYFMVQLSENPYIRAGIAVFAIGLEGAMQYVLALGKAYAKNPVIVKRFNALVLFVCYAAYILVYNIPSAVGFFVMEIDVQEAAAGKIEIAETINRQRLEQINGTIDNLNLQLAKEADTGYGSRSKAIMGQLDKLSAEQLELQKSFSETANEVSKVSKNVFRSLGEVLGVEMNLLKVVIFGTSIAMLCLILIITSWDIKIEPVNSVYDEAALSTSRRETAATKEPTPTINIPEPLSGIPSPEDRVDLIAYVSAAIRDTGKLNGNERVAEQTGITLEKCDKFKNWLIDEGLVKKGQGASVARCPKADMIRRICFVTKSPKLSTFPSLKWFSYLFTKQYGN